MKTIKIELANGKWLINGKVYNELTFEEKTFFYEFLIASKIMVQSEKQHECKVR